MKTTANYGLRKPEGTDVVDIQNFNDNADIIDAELKKRALITQIPTVPVQSVNSKTGAVTLSASDIKAADGTTLEVVKGDLSSHMADNTAHGIGDRTKLSTTAKDTIVNAINEVFQSGTNVKSSTISAVNSKGQSLSTTATWNQIIAAISSISKGQGNAVESQVLSGVDFTNADGILRHGSMPNNGGVILTPTTANQAIVQGYHSGSGYVKGDTNLVTANIKSGVSIFGVSGKSSVVETTESANPIAASTVRNGKVGYVNGSKITGSLAVQATAAQTVTPGITDQVKGAGIYDGAITIKGDSNLQSPNILKDKSIFGVTGTAVEKQDVSEYLFNFTPYDGGYARSMVGIIEGEGLWYGNPIVGGKAYCADNNGNLIKTVTCTDPSYFPDQVTNNYILWREHYSDHSSRWVTITDHNGNFIKRELDYNAYTGACLNEDTQKVYSVSSGTASIYSIDGTLLYSNIKVATTDILFFIPIKNGALIGSSYCLVTLKDSGISNYIVSNTPFQFLANAFKLF